MEQVPTAKPALEKSMWVAAAGAVTVPPQLLTTLGVLATTTFEGRLSTKLALIATTFPLVMLKVRVVDAFTPTVTGLKLVVIDGGCNTTMPILAVPPLDAPR